MTLLCGTRAGLYACVDSTAPRHTIASRTDPVARSDRMASTFVDVLGAGVMAAILRRVSFDWRRSSIVLQGIEVSTGRSEGCLTRQTTA